MAYFLDTITKFSESEFRVLHNLIEFINSIQIAKRLAVNETIEMLIKITPKDLSVGVDEVSTIDYFRDALIEMLKKDASIEYLIKKLDDYDSRFLASTLLGWYGKKAEVALPHLIDLASGANSATGSAQRSILLIGGAETQIIEAVKTSLNDQNDGDFRQLCELALKTTLRSSRDFLNILRFAIYNLNPDIREVVADIIHRLDPIYKESISGLLKELQNDQSEYVRQAAMESMKKLLKDS